MKVLSVLLLVAVALIAYQGVKSYDKRRLKFSLFFSVPFGIIYWLGQKIPFGGTSAEGLSILDIPLVLILVALFTLMSMYVLKFVDEKSYRLNKIRKNDVIKPRWWVYSLVMFVCWLPIFLVFFPGLVSNDSAVQIRQAIGESEWSNWHPVLHTAFIALPINIGMGIFGDLTAGIAFSTIVQMTVLCMIFGYVVKWVQGYTSKNWIAYVLLGFFALCPIVAGYAVTMWKDVLFSAMFLLLFVKLVDLIRFREYGERLKIRDLWMILLIMLVTAFLRNGGVLIVVGIMVALLIYYKDSWKLIVASFGGIIALMLLIQGPVYSALSIVRSPMMESLSVPAQQIGYSVKNNTITDEEEIELKKYADVECLRNNYETMNADPAKNCFDYEAVEQDKFGILLLWARLLPSHFGDYVWSYVLHTYTYWNIESDAWVLDMTHNHEEIWLKREYTDVSLLGEGVKNLVMRVYNKLLSMTGFNWLSSVGVMIWGIYYILLIFLYQKRYALLVPMSGMIIYIISLIIASPVSSIFRYVFSLLLVLPLLIVICFVKDSNNYKRKEGRK